VDSDGDGENNLHEYLAVTFPTNSNSVFTITADFTPLGGDVEVDTEFQSTRARNYALERTQDLMQPAGWTNVSGDVQGLDEEMHLMHTNAAGIGMYRVKAKLPGTP
jgi:hypothetical protein